MNLNYDNVVFKYKMNLIIKPPCSDFDRNYSMSFKQDFDDLIRLTNFNVIIIDFSKVNFIDNTGLAALMYSWHKCSGRGIELIFCNLNALSYKLFEQKGLDSIFKITDTLKNALKVGQYYTLKMKEFCSNIDKISTVFGNSSNSDSLPVACNILLNLDTDEHTLQKYNLPVAI